MKVYDTVRMLNHLLTKSFELNLRSFAIPSEAYQLLAPRWKREWKDGRWVRCLRVGPERCIPELPDMFLKASTLAGLRGLFLTMDQAAWGWSAGHYLLDARGQAIFGDIRAAHLRVV